MQRCSAIYKELKGSLLFLDAGAMASVFPVGAAQAEVRIKRSEIVVDVFVHGSEFQRKWECGNIITKNDVDEWIARAVLVGRSGVVGSSSGPAQAEADEDAGFGGGDDEEEEDDGGPEFEEVKCVEPPAPVVQGEAKNKLVVRLRLKGLIDGHDLKASVPLEMHPDGVDLSCTLKYEFTQSSSDNVPDVLISVNSGFEINKVLSQPVFQNSMEVKYSGNDALMIHEVHVEGAEETSSSSKLAHADTTGGQGELQAKFGLGKRHSIATGGRITKSSRSGREMTVSRKFKSAGPYLLTNMSALSRSIFKYAAYDENGARPDLSDEEVSKLVSKRAPGNVYLKMVGNCSLLKGGVQDHEVELQREVFICRRERAWMRKSWNVVKGDQALNVKFKVHHQVDWAVWSGKTITMEESDMTACDLLELQLGD